MDINRKLAPLLGRVLSYPSKAEPDFELKYDFSVLVESRMEGCQEEFNYKDPAIFAECVTWLLDNGYGLAKDREKGHIPMYLVYRIGGSISNDIYSKNLRKAVALAVIQAKEG